MNVKTIAVLILALGVFACEKEGNETKISSYGSSESHNAGQNCMSCHKSGGDGEGWFTLAGTIYDSVQVSTYANATVKLHTGLNGTGTLTATIQADAKGNFYTTEDINFGNGVYVSVNGNLTTTNMYVPISNGACNSCHGASTDRIWVK
ncbi:MAG: hypothetical protein JEZ09_19915 [Salinivirgaceae bacterium]|nr:hypothetical protein [Salinivirgaceae bacterium]